LYTGGAPRYTIAMSVNAGFAVGGILIVAFMRLVLLRANKRLALLEAQAQEEDHESDGQAVDSQRATRTFTFRYVT
jgi:hypothetical protein